MAKEMKRKKRKRGCVWQFNRCRLVFQVRAVVEVGSQWKRIGTCNVGTCLTRAYINKVCSINPPLRVIHAVRNL